MAASVRFSDASDGRNERLPLPHPGKGVIVISPHRLTTISAVG